ncbi:tRNA (adenosine(37)-N6)-threonylcarbamoyltransferase complex dimerization subunit type 1 TsaB [bacterium (Candidatus Torokbacteria) CG09_land_8_20_14_0_10_42_11]|nr:MAG: tRNA (adenosine(37)-N6)-threonylcarbamoyltransferase complex dimerization subunit type 1 TsaB [bacterium (Candidatus Torokbacteria) CG09_land_8_20_14_0_10_42_11]
MFLFINTSENKKLTAALVSDKRAVLDKINLEINQNHSEKLLPAVEKILKRNKIVLKDLAGVGVAAGPGSFTGVRVGVAATNALGFALDIPVVGVKCEKGKNLIREAFGNFEAGKFSRPAMPVYKI